MVHRAGYQPSWLMAVNRCPGCQAMARDGIVLGLLLSLGIEVLLDAKDTTPSWLQWSPVSFRSTRIARTYGKFILDSFRVLLVKARRRVGDQRIDLGAGQSVVVPREVLQGLAVIGLKERRKLPAPFNLARTDFPTSTPPPSVAWR